MFDLGSGRGLQPCIVNRKIGIFQNGWATHMRFKAKVGQFWMIWGVPPFQETCMFLDCAVFRKGHSFFLPSHIII